MKISLEKARIHKGIETVMIDILRKFINTNPETMHKIKQIRMEMKQEKKHEEGNKRFKW